MITRSYRIRHAKTGQWYEAELQIAAEELVRRLTARALGSKNKRATMALGAIKVHLKEEK